MCFNTVIECHFIKKSFKVIITSQVDDFLVLYFSQTQKQCTLINSHFCVFCNIFMPKNQSVAY